MGAAENGDHCYTVESPWFQNGKRYTLHIRGAQFLSKDRPPVRVNLHTLTLESDYPEDVVYLFLEYDSTVFLPQTLNIPIN